MKTNKAKSKKNVTFSIEENLACFSKHKNYKGKKS
jgi:hypothetical protein